MQAPAYHAYAARRIRPPKPRGAKAIAAQARASARRAPAGRKQR